MVHTEEVTRSILGAILCLNVDSRKEIETSRIEPRP